MNKSIKIIIKWVFAPLLAAWLFYALYQQVMAQPNLDASITLIKALPFGADAWKCGVVILLSILNWGIEARKWQLLMKPLQDLNFFTAFKSVLCGVTLSLNLPNRMGEYGGRILYVNEGNRLQAISLSIAGGIAQLIITLFLGCFGLLYLLINAKVNPVAGLSLFWIKPFLYGSIFVTIAFVLFYFRLKWLTWILEKFSKLRRFTKYTSVLNAFDAKILLRLLSLSLLRYVVFAIQYIFMLQLMQVEQNWWQSFWLVTVLFWVMAIIPSLAIAELGIKGTVAIMLFDYSGNVTGILAVTLGIWVVNLFIPALIGSLLILGIKTAK